MSDKTSYRAIFDKFKNTFNSAQKYFKWVALGSILLFIVYLIQDIAVTNVLGAYYCSQAPNPKTFVKQKIEYPESIYWEDNVYSGFNEADRKLMIIKYLDGRNLNIIALNGDDGNIYVYEASQDEFKSFKYDKKYRDRYEQYAELIFKRGKVYSKETMPEMNYTVTFNPVELNSFVKKYLYSDELKIIDNKTKEVIAYNTRYMRFYYKLVPDFAGGMYYWDRPVCGDYQHNFERKTFKSWLDHSRGADKHSVYINRYLYKKNIIGEN